MAGDELRPTGRAHPMARAGITATLFGGCTAVVLSIGVIIGTADGPARAADPLTTVGYALSAASPDDGTVADPDPADSPTDPPSETASPTPTDEVPPPVATTSPPPPPTEAPGETTPPPVVPPPPGQPGSGPQSPGPVPLGVNVSTGDVVLTPAYWNAASTLADLRVTVANTGRQAELVRLRYTLPAGLTDAGTAGCAAAGGQAAGGQAFSCASWTVASGTRFDTHVRVRVAGTAWQHLPLSGSVQVTASAVGAGRAVSVSDTQGFAVLFPPGPPVPGVSLSANEVNFDVTGQANPLDVRLGNTGQTDAAGMIEVVLPTGVSLPTLPTGCLPAGPGRTRCDLGTIPAGGAGTAQLPIVASAEAQRMAPLSGGVIGSLTPRAGKAKRLQMSFRITAVASAGLAVPDGVTPTGSQGALPPANRVADSGGGWSGVQKAAVALIVLSVMLVLLALALATTSLRRRMGVPSTAEAPPLTE